MDKGYRKRVERLQLIQAALVILCVAAIAGFIYLRTRPVVSAYLLKDECGPVGGTISHSIASDDVCRNICTAHCLSLKQTYYESTFVLKSLECNACECRCQVQQ